MNDIGFFRKYARPIVDGAKPFTLRRAWKPRTPDLGDRLRLVTDKRTPAQKVFAFAVVGFRCCVQFDETGVLNYGEWRQQDAADAVAARVRAVLDRAALGHMDAGDEFARLDGFNAYATFWNFHNGYRKPDSGPCERELIGLSMVVEAGEP